MKTQKGIFAIVFTMIVALFTTNVNAKPLHDETATFKVYGNCEMCKKRIETALKKNPAIKSADWNVETKMIKVVYDPHVLSVDQIHKIIADAGHDTDKVKANDTVYSKLPGCCKYVRKK
ncbi:MAG: heavy-metal-associated domain-containing protein [Cytophagaceae bacterium]|jgi:periplasmic mercuric ion binding protein|nr:heavy-metal-associated domain-containing protein [Cytophagaceae bacterium]